MSPRSRRPEQLATFELVPDDERDDGDGLASPEGDDGPRPPTLRDRAIERWRGLSGRARAGVAAGTAVVVLGAAAAAAGPPLLDARGERLRAEAVQGLPGAVGDLSEPLTRTWDLAYGDGVLATFPGGVVLTTDGTDARAVDVATGDEVWRRDVGPYPTCGTQAFPRIDVDRPVDVVVCLTGESDDRTVTVLDAAGDVVGTRPVGAARSDPYDESVPDRTPVVVPAAGGALAVIERVTNATAPWPRDDVPGEGTLRALRADGWVDPTLRLEDALTGEVRGEAGVHLRAEHLEQCGTMRAGDAAPVLTTHTSLMASPSFTWLSVCGASAAFTSDGAPLDTSTLTGWPQALPGGGYVVVGEESSVLAADGSLVTTVPGWLVPPMVDDDPDGPYLVLAGVGEGEDGAEVRLVAVGTDGDEDWTVPSVTSGGVLARVAGTVVVQGEAGLVGLDAATGAERWARDDLLAMTQDGSGEWVAGAVTDGTRLLLGIGGEGNHRLVALDVRDGATVWEREGKGYLEGLQAVGGHALTKGSSVRGLGAG